MRKIFAPALLALAASGAAQANIDIVFDFTYDTNNFFSSSERINALNAAASVFETRFADSLSAITSSGGNNFSTIFFNQANPFGPDITLANQSVAANVIRVYASGVDLGTNTLGMGGPGGFDCIGFGTFCSDASSRGQGTVNGPGAWDFAPWGGTISFNNTSTDWYFGLSSSGLGASQFDFYSVAVHELAHVLGFSLSDSFINLVSGNHFVGQNTGTVALTPEGHWAPGTTSLIDGIYGDGMLYEVAMGPTLASGQRKRFTDLDYAAMQDIGWQVTPVPEADTWAMLLAGLGLVGFAARRRLNANQPG